MLPKLEIDLTPNSPDFVYDTEFWVVLLAYKQIIPRLVVFPKRYFGSLPELRTKELLDFQTNVVIPIERIMKKLFQAQICNWMCLMNGAFEINHEYQPLLHWHVIGRLENPIRVGNFSYKDKYFGNIYNFYQDSVEIDGAIEQRQELIKAILQSKKITINL